MSRLKQLVLKTQNPHYKIAGASGTNSSLIPWTGCPIAAGEHQVLFWDTSSGLASSKKFQFMLSKTTLWCELMNSTLGPWWNLLQKLAPYPYWNTNALASYPSPHTAFLPDQSQFPLLALQTVDFSPSSPSVFDSISHPDSLSNLSLLFLFPWLSVSVQPVPQPPPTFPHLPFLHCMN